MTDLDGTEDGIEVELNVERLHALHGGASIITAEVEAEWLLFRRLGFRLEGRVSTLDSLVGGAAGASWKLVAHSIERSDAEPGESAMPFAFDLRAASVWRVTRRRICHCAEALRS